MYIELLLHGTCTCKKAIDYSIKQCMQACKYLYDILFFHPMCVGTLRFINASQNVDRLSVLDTTVMVMNAGPSQQAAHTNFTLSVQGSSPACCNQSAVQVPLPFYTTNTTYTLPKNNCTDATCTYIATLQATPIKSITPAAELKTFTVTFTPAPTCMLKC